VNDFQDKALPQLQRVPVLENLIDLHRTFRQGIQIQDRPLPVLKIHVFDPGFVHGVGSDLAAGFFLHCPGPAHMVGVGMGQNQPVDVAGIPPCLSHVIGEDTIRRGDAGVNEADFSTIDEISIDKTIQHFS